MAAYMKLKPGKMRRIERYLFPVICVSFASLLIFSSVLRNLKEEHHMCPVLENENKISVPKTVMTPMTALSGGIGNKLFEIVSLLGIANTLDRTPVVNVLKDDKVSALSKLFPMFPQLVQQFKFKLIPESLIHEETNNNGACCKFENPAKFENFTHENLRLKGSYLQSFKYFHHIRNEVRDWLKPSENDTKAAENLIGEQIANDFKICVHSRRGDFKTDGLHEPTHPAFARLATDFLVSKYSKTGKNVTVMLLSNDVHFSNAVFEDRLLSKTTTSNKTLEYKQRLVITYPENSPKYTAVPVSDTTPFVDLALSKAHCDIVLITAPSSTFGWWLGYLAKPDAIVYYRNIEETEDLVKKEMNQNDFYPPEWIRLGANAKGDIVES